MSDEKGYTVDIPELYYQLGVERDLSHNLQRALDGWVTLMTRHGLIRTFPASYSDMRKEAEMRIADLKHLAYPPKTYEDEGDDE